MICIECGKDMISKVIIKGSSYRSKIIRYECTCGFMTAGESGSEKLENDHLDRLARECNEKLKKIEPFVDPDEN